MYNYFIELWNFLLIISPYLILGFISAGVLSVLVKQDTIEEHLGKKKGFLPIFKAGIFGVPLPLCSCSVIPVSASLKKHGASKGSITSFLLSTPQTGIDSIMVTYGLLGPVVAIIRPIIALLSGVLSGLLVHIFDTPSDKIDSSEDCHDSCCNNSNESTIKKIFKYSFITLPKDISGPLLVGILLASLINIFPLSDFIIQEYVGDGFLSMLIMIFIGMPLYVCATASIPIAIALMSKGVTLGAAMVFLMVGPATNTTSFTTMIKIIGRKSTFITLSSLIIFSLLCGYLIDYIGITIPHTLSHAHHDHSSYSVFPIITSIILIIIMLNTFLSPYYPSKLSDNQSLTTISIQGMTCGHCTNSVKQTIESVGGKKVEVNLDQSNAYFDGDVNIIELKEKIESLGYKVEN